MGRFSFFLNAKVFYLPKGTRTYYQLWNLKRKSIEQSITVTVLGSQISTMLLNFWSGLDLGFKFDFSSSDPEKLSFVMKIWIRFWNVYLSFLARWFQKFHKILYLGTHWAPSLTYYLSKRWNWLRLWKLSHVSTRGVFGRLFRIWSWIFKFESS